MPSFFTPDDLADFQQMSNEAMDCSATIQVAVQVRGPGGTSTPSYSTQSEGVPCRLSQVSGVSNQVIEAEQLRNVAKWVVVFPVGTVIPDNSQLMVSGTDGSGAPFTITLRVIGRSPVRSNQGDVRVNAQFVS